MPNSAWKFGAIAIGFAASLCACGDSSSDATSARFEPGPCPSSKAGIPELANALCGELVVPENRSKPTGRMIRNPVAILPAVNQPPADDPIVHMTGGPGGDAIAEAPALVAMGLNQNRDLIIMDQRGDKDTTPELTCPEVDEFGEKVIGLPYDADSTRALHVAATKACHDRLVAEGIDLSAYNTTENAADFADLKKALKIDRWNVYGFSYGTNLALSFLRDHPEGIRSVVIDSVAPPSVVTLGWTWSNADEGINNIFRACAAQPECSARYGDLAATFADLVRRYEASPLVTSAEGPQGGPPVTVVIDGGHLVNWLAAIPQPALSVAEIPAAIQALADGNPAPIAKSRAFFTDPSGRGQFGHGLAFSIFCSEWVPFEPQSEILAKGLLAFPGYPDSVLSQAPQLAFMSEDCVVWDVPPASSAIR
jgi:pimeloyl-ACP methyl ester carboxylesterase